MKAEKPKKQNKNEKEKKKAIKTTHIMYELKYSWKTHRNDITKYA